MGRGQVRAGERAREATTPGSVPRGPGPAGSARFPYPKAGGVPASERAAGTITAPVRGTARAMGTGTDPVGGLAAVLGAVAMAVAVAGMAPDQGAGKGADTDLGPMTPTAPMTTKVTRTATVTAMARRPLSPSICGRSSGRF